MVLLDDSLSALRAQIQPTHLLAELQKKHVDQTRRLKEQQVTISLHGAQLDKVISSTRQKALDKVAHKKKEWEREMIAKEKGWRVEEKRLHVEQQVMETRMKRQEEEVKALKQEVEEEKERVEIKLRALESQQMQVRLWYRYLRPCVFGAIRPSYIYIELGGEMFPLLWSLCSDCQAHQETSALPRRSRRSTCGQQCLRPP